MTYFWILLISIFAAACFYMTGRVIPEEYIKYLDDAGIVLGYLISSLTVGGVVYALARQRQIKQWFKRPVFLSTGEEFEIPQEKAQAIIIPVSRREQPEWILRHLRPEYVGLVYTEMSKDYASGVVKDFKEHCKFILSQEEIESSEDIMTNPDDPAETKELTRKYIRQFLARDIHKEKIFVDTTGGKVPMSIGAFQAAEEEGVSSIYIVGTVKDSRLGFIIKDPKKAEHGKPIFLSDRTKQ